MADETVENESETIINKCPGCGATLEYDIESGNLKCAHCGTIKEIDSNSNVERRQLTDDIITSHANWDENTVYRCDNCGAKQALDKKDISRICPFCGSANVVSIEELAGIKPDSVIPFQITKDSAIERFRKWIKSRWLAPKSFKRSDIREHINGLYMSSWSFSAQTFNSYNGQLGRYVTKTRRDSNGRTSTYTETQWFNVSGQINQTYLDYFVQSGDRISPAMFNKIQPFNLKLIKVYRQEYLSGIIAEHYTRKLEICFNDFANYIRSDLRRRIMNKHNADTIGTMNIHTTYKDKKFNYVLLPIYIANYAYNKKTYNFFVNGATGEVVGKYPKSKLRLFLIGLGIAIVAAGAIAIAYFTGAFDNM